MTETEKAKDHANYLINKFVGVTMHHQFNYLVDGVRLSLAKKSALILVDEIINERSDKNFSYYDDAINQKNRLNYWDEVKQEIENY